MSEIKALDGLRDWVSHIDDNPHLGELTDTGKFGLGNIADEIQAEIESRYMLLPVDAEGVPIRVGDKVVFRSDSPVTVMSIGMSQVYGLNDCGFYGPFCNFFGSGTLSEVRHVKPRTVEDVLESFVGAIYLYQEGIPGTPTMDEIIAEHAAELQMRGDA